MECGQDERRREMRYPIQAAVTVRNSSGTIRASAANISANGMLLRVAQPTAFRIGEEVAVEVELPDNPGKPFSDWGLAKVVHIDDGGLGVQLLAGTFDRGNGRSPEA
jgi:c-di-GMP-binding flagellar brake protein YcgR